MNIYNIDKISKDKRTVFVLTYMGIEYFTEWSQDVRSNTDTQFVIVDNGNQTIPERLKEYPVFQTSKNVGCAGGWNVICYIAFKKYGMEKIVIAQDDAMFNAEMLNDIWNQTDDDTIAGAYDRSFEFSLFGLTNVFWSTVGMFDENFLYVTCEDDDYKYRAKLSNKKVISLGYSANMNKSLTNTHIRKTVRLAHTYNTQYIFSKWGRNYELTRPFGDESMSPNDLRILEGLRQVYGNIDKFPSLYETENI